MVRISLIKDEHRKSKKGFYTCEMNSEPISKIIDVLKKYSNLKWRMCYASDVGSCIFTISTCVVFSMGTDLMSKLFVIIGEHGCEYVCYPTEFIIIVKDKPKRDFNILTFNEKRDILSL